MSMVSREAIVICARIRRDATAYIVSMRQVVLRLSMQDEYREQEKQKPSDNSLLARYVRGEFDW